MCMKMLSLEENDVNFNCFTIIKRLAEKSPALAAASLLIMESQDFSMDSSHDSSSLA